MGPGFPLCWGPYTRPLLCEGAPCLDWSRSWAPGPHRQAPGGWGGFTLTLFSACSPLLFLPQMQGWVGAAAASAGEVPPRNGGGGAGTPSSSCEAPAAPLRSPLCSSRFPGTSTPAGRSAPPLAFSTPQSKDTRLKSASFPPLTCQGRDASPIPTSPVLTYSALPMERVAREGPPNPCWWLLRLQGNWPGPDPTLASCSPESASVVCRRAGREQLPGGGGGRCRGGTLSIAG